MLSFSMIRQAETDTTFNYILECTIFRLANQPSLVTMVRLCIGTCTYITSIFALRKPIVIDSIKDEANKIIKKGKKLVNLFANIQANI